MTTKPFRLRVLEELTALLNTITVANGYNHDLAGHVFRGRMSFGAGDPVPLIAILEVPVPFEMLASSTSEAFNSGVWGLLIQGFVPDDPMNPTDPAHFLMADVKKCLGLHRKERARSYDFLNMGNKVGDIEIGPGTVRPPDETSALAYFWLGLNLKIVEDNAEPYV